jgi:hypothetical protein
MADVGKPSNAGQTGRARNRQADAPELATPACAVCPLCGGKVEMTGGVVRAALECSACGLAARVEAVTFSPDGRWLVSGSSDATARLWDLTANDPAASSVVLRGHGSAIHAVCVSPDNRRVVTASGQTGQDQRGAVRIWDLCLDDLLERAQEVTAQCLNAQQRQQVLLESARRGEMLR